MASSSKGNCYLISDGVTTLLLDAGISLKAIQVGCGFNLGKIDACMITHQHKDHSKAAADLARKGIDIYTGQETIEACGLSGHRIHPVKSLREVKVGSFQVLPFDLQHDVPNLGYVFTSEATGEKLAYITDTGYIRFRFSALDILMIECNYDTISLWDSVKVGDTPVEMVPRLARTHMNLDTLIEMLRANDLSRLRQIYLLHMSGRNADAERIRETVQRATGAEVYVG